MLKTLKRLIRRRKAVSPIISAILLITLTVVSVSIVYYLIIPFFNRSNLFATIEKVKDTNKDSRYDQITLSLSNTGTKTLEIMEVIIWTTPKSFLGDQSAWEKHEGWNFTRAGGNIIYPSINTEENLQGDSQIELTIDDETYYRLEIYYSSQRNPYYTQWQLLNDQVDFSDLLNDYETFDLPAWGFTGTIDVPGWVSNNYKSKGGPEHGPLIAFQYIYLPVKGETKYVKFYITDKIVIFHSTNGNLTGQPKFQEINRTDNPFRARKLFLLGLAGSWGDEFPPGRTALTMKITYTDGSSQTWNMGHERIDDWWYNSNNGRRCDSARYGVITEINLGTQIMWPNQPIHTHTDRFLLNYYKYIQFISFTDPGTDQAGPHLLSISAG